MHVHDSALTHCLWGHEESQSWQGWGHSRTGWNSSIYAQRMLVQVGRDSHTRTLTSPQTGCCHLKHIRKGRCSYECTDVVYIQITEINAKLSDRNDKFKWQMTDAGPRRGPFLKHAEITSQTDTSSRLLHVYVLKKCHIIIISLKTSPTIISSEKMWWRKCHTVANSMSYVLKKCHSIWCCQKHALKCTV